MTSSPDFSVAFILLCLGLLVVLIAIFRPNWTRYIPGNVWFSGAYRAKRVGTAVGGATLIIMAIWILGLIPQSAKGLVVLTWGFVLLGAAVCDMPNNNDNED